MIASEMASVRAKLWYTYIYRQRYNYMCKYI